MELLLRYIMIKAWFWEGFKTAFGHVALKAEVLNFQSRWEKLVSCKFRWIQYLVSAAGDVEAVHRSGHEGSGTEWSGWGVRNAPNAQVENFRLKLNLALSKTWVMSQCWLFLALQCESWEVSCHFTLVGTQSKRQHQFLRVLRSLCSGNEALRTYLKSVNTSQRLQLIHLDQRNPVWTNEQ